ncbi:unnamed protein product [Lepeophtheirus salmonis]|uniref:(salmon louse) hypothetical protein n=1 Tax=Lepeophtheirus salmonis TaxID=72036 RepID=A0A7R8CHU0_LEPSM|nr:unnamed protein product [Lepeophtheirus salmonis]CAF2772048.1 unnamed protein product [Lepeophtheirus salmonis]
MENVESSQTLEEVAPQKTEWEDMQSSPHWKVNSIYERGRDDRISIISLCCVHLRRAKQEVEKNERRCGLKDKDLESLLQQLQKGPLTFKLGENEKEEGKKEKSAVVCHHVSSS